MRSERNESLAGTLRRDDEPMTTHDYVKRSSRQSLAKSRPATRTQHQQHHQRVPRVAKQRAHRRADQHLQSTPPRHGAQRNTRRRAAQRTSRATSGCTSTTSSDNAIRATPPSCANAAASVGGRRRSLALPDSPKCDRSRQRAAETIARGRRCAAVSQTRRVVVARATCQSSRRRASRTRTPRR